MRSIFRSLAGFVAVACLVWVGVLWRWQATQREFDTGDIALYLCALPITVFALAWAARWAVSRALRVQDAKASAAAAKGSPGNSAATESADSPPTTWHLLSAAVRVAAGETVDELLAATEAGAPRPRPDPELHDDDGLPVMTARIVDIDLDAVESDLHRHADDGFAAPAGSADAFDSAFELPPRAVRALAILWPLVDELTQSIDIWSQQWEDAAAPATIAAAASTPLPGAAAETDKLVRVLAAWPTDWDDATCAVAHQWLIRHLCTPLAATLPAARWSVQTQRMGGADLLAAAERTLGALGHQGRDDPLVLMACHSDLDPAAIQALESRQRLFNATRRPKGAMAGEGAAVVVFSAVAWPADAAIEPERVRLVSPALAPRSQSIEAPGRATLEETVALARLGLARAGPAGNAVSAVASDADQHTARATELFAVTLALTPELDARDDFRLVGTLTGRLEAVAPLVTLACAAAQARASGRPALALSLGDSHWRAVAVLCPESFSAAPPSPPA